MSRLVYCLANPNERLHDIFNFSKDGHIIGCQMSTGGASRWDSAEADEAITRPGFRAGGYPLYLSV
jgi:hypothetical protein